MDYLDNIITVYTLYTTLVLCGVHGQRRVDYQGLMQPVMTGSLLLLIPVTTG